MENNSAFKLKFSKNLYFCFFMILLYCIPSLFAQQTNNLQVIWVRGPTAESLSFAYGIDFTSGDFNGDGYSDVVIQDDSLVDRIQGIYICKAYIFLGGTQIDTIPDIIIASDTTWGFMRVRGIGDINADGFDDLALGSQNGPDGFGRVYIYLGGNPMDTICDFQIRGPHNASLFGEAISSGDVNGDGVSDLIVGAYGAAPGVGGYDMGQVYIYYGGSNFNTTPDVILNGGHHNDREGFGSFIGQCADVNNDGYDDMIIDAVNFGACNGRLYIYFGGNPMDTIADVTMIGEGPNQHLGWDAISSLRNANNFDYAMIGTPLWPQGFPMIGNGKIYILYGGNLMDSIPDICMIGRTATSGLSQSLSRTGYISTLLCDGVISGVPRESNEIGYAYIWRGEPNLDTIYDAWLRGSQYREGVGWGVVSAGDVNGDGRDEIMISNYASPQAQHRVWVCKYTGTGIEENYYPPPANRLPLEVYPNPVRTQTAIRFSLTTESKVSLDVYDITGKIVKMLNTSHTTLDAGEYCIRWDLRDDKQKRVANGIYFIELIAEHEKEIVREIRKITVSK
jgi:hypothetical protein